MKPGRILYWCIHSVVRKHWIGIAVLFLFLFIVFVPGLLQRLVIEAGMSGAGKTTVDPAAIVHARDNLEDELQQTATKLARRTPRSFYLVINSSSNKFTLYSGKTVTRKGRCSTGSYILLKNGDAQQWIFRTPRGEYRIQGKIVSPVWKKPDWAFVEDGLPVPEDNHYSRFEYGVLGDYALDLGQGYLIHGTLYQRFLGLPVTHGCVRMGDEDLEVIYHALSVGSRVFIY